jgi:hypothetical protein
VKDFKEVYLTSRQDAGLEFLECCKLARERVHEKPTLKSLAEAPLPPGPQVTDAAYQHWKKHGDMHAYSDCQAMHRG